MIEKSSVEKKLGKHLFDRVVELLNDNERIKAIKVLREELSLDLKSAYLITAQIKPIPQFYDPTVK